jgi:fucose permease
MATITESVPFFKRTRLTWQAYITNGYYSYLLNALGPLTPFLREEMRLSYTIASLHFSAYAIGLIVAGLILKRVVQRFGEHRMVWAGVFGMGFGTLLLITGRNPLITVFGSFLMGFLGAYISALFSMALAEQHGSFRAIALTESTMFASLVSTLASVAVSVFSRTFLTWRAALALMILVIPFIWIIFHKDPIHSIELSAAASSHSTDQPKKRLPLSYWIYWVAVLVVESIEFCIIFWASDFLEKVGGLTKSDAVLGVSVFMGAMLVGRWLMSRLLHTTKEQQLLKISLIAATIGFLFFWFSPDFGALKTVAGLLGLAIAGLGIAGQFPIMNALALSTVPDQMVEGSAKVSLAAGLAVLLLPLLLGRLADWFGIRAAYSLELALLILAFILLWVADLNRKKSF